MAKSQGAARTSAPKRNAPLPLTPRVAFITGGASGIGRAIAETLVRDGWHVALADTNALELARTQQALECLRQESERFSRPEARQSKDQGPVGDSTQTRRALGVVADTFTVDITDEAAVASVIATLVAKTGRLDGVVNSAGIARDIPALDTSVELFRKILDVNLIGTFIVCQAAARAMKSQGHGAIVNLASVSGIRGSKGRVAYGASKGGVVTLTQVLANEWAPLGIRVNALAPGPIDTPLVAKLHSTADRELWHRTVPQRRYGSPQDVAEAAAFLLDDTRAGYITGAILPVDGGFTAAGVIAQ